MIEVAVAIIINKNDQVLIAQRPLTSSHGGMWEFPGGKLEPNESAEEALTREVKEEIGLEILRTDFLSNIIHNYPNKQVKLISFIVTEYIGNPTCKEGQLDMKWVSIDQLSVIDFPEANKKIIPLIKNKYNLLEVVENSN